jgi:hypothetical protein
MSLISHAKFELELQGLLNEEGDFYGGMTGKAVMELIEVFSNQGHSGMSASIVRDLFNKLSNYEQLGSLTGKEEEWNFLDYGDEIKYQNKRNSAVFKYEDGTVTYNRAIIKKCPNGSCWSGPLYLTREDAINGINLIRIAVKSFPFTPKTFYIDVIEEDDWIMYVKDSKQLEEVFEYYQNI